MVMVVASSIMYFRFDLSRKSNFGEKEIVTIIIVIIIPVKMCTFFSKRMCLYICVYVYILMIHVDIFPSYEQMMHLKAQM